MLETNRVIIRIWASKNARFQQTHGYSFEQWRGADVGHISIEIPILAERAVAEGELNYFSFWPDWPAWEARRFDLQAVPGEFKANYAADCAVAPNAESRPADFVICLYSLHILPMYEEFKRIKNDPNRARWAVFPRAYRGNVYNCVGLAAKLLEVGNLIELAPMGRWSSGSLTALPPDLFIKKMCEAKTNELVQAAYESFMPVTPLPNGEKETNIRELKMSLGWSSPFGVCAIL